jgi:hypothetical protein
LLSALDTNSKSDIKDHINDMFRYSKASSSSLKDLDKMVKDVQSGPKAEFLSAATHLFGKRRRLPWLDKLSDALQLNTLRRFEAQNILSDSAKAMRAPSDFTSFMFVAGVIGFFPVWLIQAIAETEYRLRKGHSHRKIEDDVKPSGVPAAPRNLPSKI